MTENETVVTPPKIRPAGSQYLILEYDQANWTERGVLTARSAEAAILKHAEKNTEQTGGTFVAIAKRHWSPTKVKAETVTTLKLEEVK